MITKRKLKKRIDEIEKARQEAFTNFYKSVQKDLLKRDEQINELQKQKETLDLLHKRIIDLEKSIMNLQHERQEAEDQPSLSEQIAEWFDGPKEGTKA